MTYALENFTICWGSTESVTGLLKDPLVYFLIPYVTYLQTGPSRGSINYSIKDSLSKESCLGDPGCWKNQQMKRFEDNELTKVLKDDCERSRKERKWLIFICPSEAISLWMNSFCDWGRTKDFHNWSLICYFYSTLWLSP